jgi:hypothetical protein
MTESYKAGVTLEFCLYSSAMQGLKALPKPGLLGVSSQVTMPRQGKGSAKPRAQAKLAILLSLDGSLAS